MKALVVNLLFLVAFASPVAAKQEIKMDPRRTYFPTIEGDFPFMLGTPVLSGEWMALQTNGDYDAGAGLGDVIEGLTAIFTRNCCGVESPIVFTAPPMNVSDVPSFVGGPVDVEHDFSIPIGPDFIVVQVPNIQIDGIDSVRVSLQLSPPDTFFADNTDPDGDYFLTIFREEDFAPVRFNEFVTPCVNSFPVSGCEIIFEEYYQGSVEVIDLAVGTDAGLGFGHGTVVIEELGVLNTETASVGLEDQGDISVIDGGVLHISKNATIGVDSQGSVHVERNSLLQAESHLSIGAGALGRLEVDELSSVEADAATIGALGRGEALIDRGSTMTISADLRIGTGADGVLSLSRNSTVDVERLTAIGSGGSGTLNISSSSELRTGGISVGEGSSGALFADTGGSVIAPRGATIGSDSGEGVVVIGGFGSSLRVGGSTDGNLVIGSSGTGVVSASNGGHIRVLGAANGPAPHQPRIFLGANDGSGTLLIGPGGRLTVEDIARTGVDDGIQIGGSGNSSFGRLEVFGPDAVARVLGNNSFINVGSDGVGELRVAEHANLEILGTESFSILNIGSGEDSRGSILVEEQASVSVRTDAGSFAGSFLFMGAGSSSSSMLEVRSGAQVLLEPDIPTLGGAQIGIGSGSSATVTIDGLGSTLDTAAAALIGTVTEFGFSSLGSGTVNLRDGGTLRASAIIVGVDGKIGGAGILDGNVENRGGLITPGLSPGTLEVGGDFVQTSGELLIEVAGLESGQFDLIDAMGNINILDGSLIIRMIDGFLFDANDEILFLTALGGIGISDEVQIEVQGAAAGFEFVLQNTPNGTSFLALNDALPAAVPLPPAFLLFFACGIFSLCARRERRETRAQSGPSVADD